MNTVFFIHQDWVADMKAYAGDDPDALMAKAMLARGELVEMDRIVIRQTSPPLEKLTLRIKTTPDHRAYLKLWKHWKGGRR